MKWKIKHERYRSAPGHLSAGGGLRLRLGQDPRSIEEKREVRRRKPPVTLPALKLPPLAE